MIHLEHISKTYTRKKEIIKAVDDVSIDIKAGEIFGIIGFSGAGKSTLVRCINLLENPDAGGKVTVDGVELTSLNSKELRRQRSNIGMIFQHFNLMPSRTVLENVLYPLAYKGIKKGDQIKKATELLKLVDLSDRIDNYPSQLSGGQKQRVAIARALANNPEILLCDEATSALDPDNTKEVIQTLKNIKQKYPITVLFITHQMEVAKSLFDRVAVMSNGKVVEVGSSYDVFAHPQSDAAKNLINKSFEGVVPPEVLEHEKNLYLITFKEENAYEPVISDISRRFTNTDLSIIAGNIEYIQKKPLGRLLISLRGNDANEIDSVLSVLKGKAYVHKYTFAKGVENV